MNNNWFQKITNSDISCDENIPNWLKDGVNDSKYVIIEKANYEINLQDVRGDNYLKTHKLIDTSSHT